MCSGLDFPKKLGVTEPAERGSAGQTPSCRPPARFPASALPHPSPRPLPGAWPQQAPPGPRLGRAWRGGGELQEVAAPAPPRPHPGKSQGLAPHFDLNTSSLKSRAEGLRRWEVPGERVGRGETGKLLLAGRGRDRSIQVLPGAPLVRPGTSGSAYPGSGWHLWGALLNQGTRGVARAELCSRRRGRAAP